MLARNTDIACVLLSMDADVPKNLVELSLAYQTLDKKGVIVLLTHLKGFKKLESLEMRMCQMSKWLTRAMAT